METTAIKKCMDLFLSYPFNNALHRHVATLLLSFDAGSDAVIDYLLGECNMLQWLASAPEEVRPSAVAPAVAPVLFLDAYIPTLLSWADAVPGSFKLVAAFRSGQVAWERWRERSWTGGLAKGEALNDHQLSFFGAGGASASRSRPSCCRSNSVESRVSWPPHVLGKQAAAGGISAPSGER